MTFKNYLRKTALGHLVALSIFAGQSALIIKSALCDHESIKYQKNNPDVVKVVNLEKAILNLNEGDLRARSKHYSDFVSEYNVLMSNSQIKSGVEELRILRKKSQKVNFSYALCLIPFTIVSGCEIEHFFGLRDKYKEEERKKKWRRENE